MNHVTLTGRLTADAEIGEGNRPDRFRIAFERKKGDEYESAFIAVSAWLKAEHAEEMLTKGTLITVSGELDWFTTKDGNTVFTILARDVGPAAYARGRGDREDGGSRKASSRSSGRSNGTSRRRRDEDEEPF